MNITRRQRRYLQGDQSRLSRSIIEIQGATWTNGTRGPNLVTNTDQRTQHAHCQVARQVLDAIAEFDNAMTIVKLRGVRERKRTASGKWEGRKSLAETYPAVVREAKRLARANPRLGRKIAAQLAKIGGALTDTGPGRRKDGAALLRP